MTSTLAPSNPPTSGLMPAAHGGGLSDHGSWGYGSAESRAAAAARWLTDGLRLGQRALYVAEGSPSELVAELESVPDVSTHLDSGALVVMPSTEVHDVGTPVDAARQLEVYATALDRALGGGYCGLRVAADITPHVADRALRAAHLHWEQIAGRYITEHPLAPLCMYDQRRVPEANAIHCAHAMQGPAQLPFALYGVGPTEAMLEGEVDRLFAAVFSELLAGLPRTDRIIDLSRLSFIDGHSLSLLHDALLARRHAGQDVVASGAGNTVRQVWDIFGFDPSFLAA